MDKSKRKKRIIWGIVGVIVLFFVVKALWPTHKQLVWHVETIDNGVVEQTVTATGYVQPVETVNVGTQVSGKIEAIYVDFNSHVTKGQLLAELDKSTLNEQLTQAIASEQNADAALTLATQTYNRTKQLYDNNAATQADFEAASAQLIQAKSNLATAKTRVREARVNLGYAEIYSTIDGVVLDRKVDVGQTVAASFSTPDMFIIAKDLKNMQVEANIDEADIGQVRVGQKVRFTVDAYQGDTFNGTVGQIRLQPVVTSNVVTYTVVINTPNPDEKLFPGMTASVAIVTKSDSSLVVPLEALGFEPDMEVLKMLDKQNTKAMPNNPRGGRQVWVKKGNSITPVPVKVGFDDGVNAILVDGVSKGDSIVLSLTAKDPDMEKSASLFPGPPKRRTGTEKK
ncbi:MAG: efflux RND transporter periplasmic adaptor subunit [Paludibacteraceae bacterium]|nr:efflux RND transporter periplasmic adaptor subunit [Paludibacteraceae bacterium]